MTCQPLGKFLMGILFEGCKRVGVTVYRNCTDCDALFCCMFRTWKITCARQEKLHTLTRTNSAEMRGMYILIMNVLDVITIHTESLICALWCRVVEFATHSDMRNAIDKLDDTELNGRRIRLIEDTRRSGRRRSRSSSSRSHSRSRSRSRRRSRTRSR